MLASLGDYETYEHGSSGAIKAEADGGEEDDHTGFNDAIGDSDGEGRGRWLELWQLAGGVDGGGIGADQREQCGPVERPTMDHEIGAAGPRWLRPMWSISGALVAWDRSGGLRDSLAGCGPAGRPAAETTLSRSETGAASWTSSASMAGAPEGSELLPSFVGPERAGWANSGVGNKAGDGDLGPSGWGLDC